jgi:hypothetical protein
MKSTAPRTTQLSAVDMAAFFIAALSSLKIALRAAFRRNE